MFDVPAHHSWRIARRTIQPQSLEHYAVHLQRYVFKFVPNASSQVHFH